MKRLISEVSVLLCAAVLVVACNEKEQLPVFIDSEVMESGIDKDITASVSTDKKGLKTTTLSYKSWLRIKGQTKGNYDGTVSVKLNNTLIDSEDETIYDKDTTIIWGNLDLSVFSTRKSYKVRGTRKEGYVTIIDSVLVYTVDYKGFVISYELDYEVGEYDDGITKQTLPYYRIENLVDKGSTSTRLDKSDDGTYIYARKLIEHTISVDCNGKTYDIVAQVTVNKILEGFHQPYVLKSEIDNPHAFTVDNYCVMSFIDVKKYWSDKSETTETVYVQLTPFSYGPWWPDTAIPKPAIEYPGVIRGYADAPLDLLSFAKVQGRSNHVESSENYGIYYDYVYHTWRLHYNHFDLDFEILFPEAYYDDGYTCFKFPTFEITDFSCDPPIVSSIEEGDDEGGHYTVRRLGQTVSAMCQDIPITFLDGSTLFKTYD